LHDLAILAEVGIADSMYSNKAYSEAENAYNDFVSLHPVNENVPYAIYQSGMCHYNQMEDIDRDQTETIKAKKEWEKLVARYPESKFSAMAEKLIRECKQKLAEQEFMWGGFISDRRSIRQPFRVLKRWRAITPMSALITR